MHHPHAALTSLKNNARADVENLSLQALHNDTTRMSNTVYKQCCNNDLCKIVVCVQIHMGVKLELASITQ